MKLLYCLLWTESRRLRTHLMLIAITLVFLGIYLGLDFSQLQDIETHFHGEFHGNSDFPHWSSQISPESFISLLAIGIPSLAAIAAISLVAIIAPFRSPSEWRDGQFQLVKMSSWSLYQVQLLRFLIFSVMALVPSILVATGLSLAVAKNTAIQIAHLPHDVFWIAVFMVLSFQPIAIACGTLMESLRTAYYQRGLPPIVSLIQFLAWWMIISSWQKVLPALQLHWLPALQLKAHESLPQHPGQLTELYWEPVLLSILAAVIMVLLSGRVLEESES